jgi:hypothetical protein
MVLEEDGRGTLIFYCRYFDSFELVIKEVRESDIGDCVLYRVKETIPVTHVSPRGY